MKKQLGAFFVLLAFVFVAALPAEPAEAAAHVPSQYTLTLNGQPVALSKPILLVNNRSMLPMRSFFETLGATVTWDPNTRTATATKGPHQISFPIDGATVTSDGVRLRIDVPAQLIEGSTYVPVRTAAESLGFQVRVDERQVIDLRPGQIGFSSGVMHVDAAWYQEDRAHVAALLEQVPKDYKATLAQIYREYQILGKELSNAQSRAYHSPRGYVLYSPSQTVEINMLWRAVWARGNILKHANQKTLYDLEDYMPQDLSYFMVNYDMREAGAMMPTSFTGFNQEKITATLDALPVPDYYLYGTPLFFIPARFAGLSGYNSLFLSRGSYANVIVIFDTSKSSVDYVRSTTTHELGHSLGKEFFNTWAEGSVFQIEENIATETEYARIYGQDAAQTTESGVPWTQRLEENFAEDFSYLNTGAPKLTGWSGNHTEEVRAFIARHLAAVPYDKIPAIKGLTVTLDGLEMPRVGRPTYELNPRSYLVSRDGVVHIKLEGLQSGGYTIGAYLTDSRTGLRFIPVAADGTLSFTLPARGQTYTVFLGVADPSQRYVEEPTFGSLGITFLQDP